MKKSLIALAVAGVVAAPAAFAATSNVDVYGKLRISLSYVDPDTGKAGWQLDDEASRIGFKGSEDLGGGMKAIWQIEQGITTNSGNPGYTGGGVGNGSLATRNTFVGLAGGFGTFLMGRHDSPYKLAGSADLFVDTLADAQNNGGIIGANGFDNRFDRAVAYITPDFSGFHAAVATVPGATAKKELTDGYAVALVYGNGPLKLTAGYEDHNNIAKETSWKVNGGYTMGDLTLGATYEDQDLVGTASSKNYLVSAAYGMGPITLALQYGDRNGKNGAAVDLKRTTAGVIYSLSKRTNVALAYNHDDPTGSKNNVDAVTFQMNHDF